MEDDQLHRVPYRRLTFKAVSASFFLAVLLPACASAQTPDAAKAPVKIENSDCFSCHLDNPPIVDKKIFDGSIHKGLACVDCHTDVKEVPHDDNLKINVPSSPLYWANVPKTCGRCHEKEYREYTQGIHGQALAAGSRDTPVCTDCHGEHNNQGVKSASSKVSAANIPQTCGQCHAAERINAKYSLSSNVFDSYMQSYHGLGLKQGTVTAANCASCHGAHEILPSSDPRSSIHPKNLENTCGQCHPGIGVRVAQGKVHGSFKEGINPLNDWVRNFYICLIFCVSGILLLHNLLDFAKKASAHYRYSKEQGKECFGLNERIQHVILTAGFMLLAYTGFSLKFPQTWWSSMFYGHGDWLRWGHRGCGIIFSGLALYHLYYLLMTRKGRWQLKMLSIKVEDFAQFFQSFQYYFGRRREKPPVGTYSYVQKLEYWALLWGSMVMVVTGALMFSEVWFLSLFPKWFYDVVRTVHLYEAILACVTIIIWHGYFVMFDPDVYPGNFSWIHGRHSCPKDAGN